jgi:pilus assembly protein CpaE
MEVLRTSSANELTALLISPDRTLAQAFTKTLPHAHTFQILADLKAYPPQQTLEMRLRQLKPEVVLLDLASDLDAACEVIRTVAGEQPHTHVVGLHARNDSEAVLRSLRMGATEFLCAPFDVDVQREAVARLFRLSRPNPSVNAERGKVLLFSSAKPGSGASTLSTQTSLALRRLTNSKVLLMDFDLLGGTVGFFLKVDNGHSLVEAIEHSDHLSPSFWCSLVSDCSGVDVLPAPAEPCAELDDAVRIHDLLEFARQNYEWVVVDLPAIFHRVSLLTLAECDQAYLVTTSELASLHLARKAVNLLAQLGFGKDRFHLVVNRLNKRDGIGSADIEKIFNCHLHACLPNDYSSLHRVVTLGQPLGPDSELGRSVDNLASRLSGATATARRGAGVVLGASPILSET